MRHDARIGDVQVPKAKWSGRWLERLKLVAAGEIDGSEDPHGFIELTEYKKTTAYQVARSLNLHLPTPPEGKDFEFGAKESGAGSTLLVRLVDAA